MALYVLKFGGSSLKDIAHISSAASRVASLYQKGHKLIVVVSAMGKTTNELIDLAYQISKTPSLRELDMLLSTGERISSALFCLALQDLNIPAISFTGSQAGILTNEAHSNARIIDLKPIRLETELNKNKVIVLAGFQGVEPKNKEITTLGRGGTDTTAVAMAAYFDADHCGVLKDVPGILSADPKFVERAIILKELSFEELTEITFAGAKVLHYRAVELAKIMGVPLFIGPASSFEEGTHIVRKSNMYEESQILAINSHTSIRLLNFQIPNLGECFEELKKLLNQFQLPWPQILSTQNNSHGWSFILTGPLEILKSMDDHLLNSSSVKIIDPELCSLTLTCHGCVASDLPFKVTQFLNKKEISISHFLLTPLSLTLFVPEKKWALALNYLHENFIETVKNSESARS